MHSWISLSGSSEQCVWTGLSCQPACPPAQWSCNDTGWPGLPRYWQTRASEVWLCRSPRVPKAISRPLVLSLGVVPRHDRAQCHVFAAWHPGEVERCCLSCTQGVPGRSTCLRQRNCASLPCSPAPDMAGVSWLAEPGCIRWPKLWQYWGATVLNLINLVSKQLLH